MHQYFQVCYAFFNSDVATIWFYVLIQMSDYMNVVVATKDEVRIYDYIPNEGVKPNRYIFWPIAPWKQFFCCMRYTYIPPLFSHSVIFIIFIFSLVNFCLLIISWFIDYFSFRKYEVAGRLIDLAIFEENLPRRICKSKSSSLIFIITGIFGGDNWFCPGPFRVL